MYRLRRFVRYACVRCGLGSSSVGCALFLLCSFFVDKRRMIVPFGGTGLMEETQLLVLGQSGDSITFPGIDFIQQSTTNVEEECRWVQ